MQLAIKSAQFFGFVVAAFLFVTALLTQKGFADDIVLKGREIVRQHCTRCHVVPNMNPYGGIGSTLSFAAMKWLDDWEQRFDVFYTLPTHLALVNIDGISEVRSKFLLVLVSEIELQLEEINAILAFARTLKTLINKRYHSVSRIC